VRQICLRIRIGGKFVNQRFIGNTRNTSLKLATAATQKTRKRQPAAGGCRRLLRVSPHTIRHTMATHLLHSGVDINTIRARLGHVSLTTTNVYAEVDLEMSA
jgi:site-specific recombinase XerD